MIRNQSSLPSTIGSRKMRFPARGDQETIKFDHNSLLLKIGPGEGAIGRGKSMRLDSTMKLLKFAISGEYKALLDFS